MLGDLRQDQILHDDTDFSDPEILSRRPYRNRRSPIMITLADPKVASQDIQKMVELGINIVKFKTSHCTKGDQIKLLGKLDKAVKFLCKKHATLDWPITTCLELKTSIIKTGFLEGENEFVHMKEGHTTVLIYDINLFDKCTERLIFIDNPNLVLDVEVGKTISLSQNEVILQCINIINDKSITCVVVKAGYLKSMATAVIRGGIKSPRPLLSDKDFNLITFAMDYEIDMIVVNYARDPETIRKIKRFMGRKIKRPIIFAGLSTPQGLKNIDDIIQESDGIVFSREFLAYELDEVTQYRLIHIQKLVGAKCQQAGKPFFISGDVFNVALHTGKFIASETAEITNAILDGVTGFVLKACNNVNIHLEVIEAMNDLCCCIEPLTNNKTHFWRVLEGIQFPVNAAEAAAISCAALAHQTKSRVIVIPTVTGHTAKTLMWLQPSALVITVSTKTSATKRLQSYRSVIPLLFPGGHYKNWYLAVEARVEFAVEYAVKLGWLKLGDSYVTLQRGSEDSAFCDMVRSWRVAITRRAVVECTDESAKKLSSYNRRSRSMSMFLKAVK